MPCGNAVLCSICVGWRALVVRRMVPTASPVRLQKATNTALSGERSSASGSLHRLVTLGR